jgi:aminomethyltransferase
MLSRYFDERGVRRLSIASGGSTPEVFCDSRREHLATRRDVGLFDFSFMGCWEIIGRDSIRFLQSLQTRDIRALNPGKICYTLLCNGDGRVVSDATVWCHSPDHFWLFSGNRNCRAHIAMCAQGHDVAIGEIFDRHAVLAIQGPRSHGILARMLPSSTLANLRYFGFRKTRFCNHDAWIGRLGYSGELGYEVIVPTEAAVEAWERIRTEGRTYGLLECGFDAAHSLRVEAGYILFSRELGESPTPYELGLGRLVELHRGTFIGAAALRALRRNPPPRRLVGIRFERLAATGRNARYTIAATVTSECFSPTFGCRLALGFVDSGQGCFGRVVYAEDGRRGRIARLPFYDPARVLPRR